MGKILVTKSVQRVGGKWLIGEPKTRAGIRAVSLRPQAVALLTRLAQERLAKGGGSLVFSRGSEPLHRATVAHAMRRECDRLGLPRLTPHGLRHLHASLLLARGLPIPAVSQRLGHANSAITMSTYAHYLGRDDTQATEAIGRALGQRR